MTDPPNLKAIVSNGWYDFMELYLETHNKRPRMTIDHKCKSAHMAQVIMVKFPLD